MYYCAYKRSLAAKQEMQSTTGVTKAVVCTVVHIKDPLMLSR